MRRIVFFLFPMLVLGACQSEKKEGWKPLDLMSYGVPLTILAPDSVSVKTEDWGATQELWVHLGREFDVQILSSNAGGVSVEAIIDEQKTDVQAGKFFSKMIQEDPAGFIYENVLDSTRFTYGFRFVKIKGDKEFLFRSGLSGIYTQEAVTRMYEAVQ